MADLFTSAVNNAGIAGPEDLLTATPEMLEAYFGVNVFGPLYMTQAVVGAGKMPRGGRIINIGSIASKMGLQVASIYAAAKAAQDSMTASWAGEVSFYPLSFVLSPVENVKGAPYRSLRLVSTPEFPDYSD